MDNKPPGITKVKIFDQTYSIRADKDPEYISRVAEFVDERMRDIARTTPTVDTLRVAVLTALNIADEHFQLRQKYSEADRAIGQKALALVGALDQILS